MHNQLKKSASKVNTSGNINKKTEPKLSLFIYTLFFYTMQQFTFQLLSVCLLPADSFAASAWNW